MRFGFETPWRDIQAGIPQGDGPLGWKLLRVSGSHHQLGHAQFPGVLTVAMHGTISRVAVKKTLKTAGIEEDELLEAL